MLARDEVHKVNKITWEDVWESGSEQYLISDSIGPLMIARSHTALRIAFQFDSEHTYRTAKAAKEVVRWFTGLAKDRGATEVVIRPGGKARSFTTKLGFKDFIGKFLKVGG